MTIANRIPFIKIDRDFSDGAGLHNVFSHKENASYPFQYVPAIPLWRFAENVSVSKGAQPRVVT